MRKVLSYLLVLVLVLSGLGAGGFLQTDLNIATKNVDTLSICDEKTVEQYHSEREGDLTHRDWTIVETYAIPEGAAGLAFDGTSLYCGIYGVNGDYVYQIDPTTGSYSLLCAGPQEDAFGLTYDGANFWTTDHPGGISTPAIAMQFDTSGTLLSQFDLPAHYMSGIAYDDGDFWVAAYYDPDGQIYKVNDQGDILTQFASPDNQPWDLCLENNNLWMADYWGDALYKIDPTTGALLETHDSEGVDPAGIVWDGQYLWYCDNGQGYDQDYLYKVDLGGSGTPAINIPVTTHNYGIVSIGDISTWNAVVESVGTTDLLITGVSFTGTGSEYLSCSVSFPVSVGTGSQISLPLSYEPLMIGPLTAIASVESNDPVNPTVDITLTGNGVETDPDIFIAEDTHDYGGVRVSATTRWLMEIQNVGNNLLTITDITSDDSHFFIDNQLSYPVNIGVLETIEIGVWFQPDSEDEIDATILISSNDPDENPYEVTVEGSGIDTMYPIGDQLWQYEIDTSWDNSPKAIAPLPDVSGDGVHDVIVCSEDDYVRCFNGNSHGTADMLWEHEIYSGSVYSQNGLAITEDVDSDGCADVVVASAWGGRLIRTLSGKTGEIVWTHDTHEYGDGGWVYSVDCSYDYNSDGVIDVLASTGDDSNDQGPKRIYCLDGQTGVSIWECPLGGPGFAAIGVQDFTGDAQPDVVAGASNEGEDIGYAYGINGASGSIEWTFVVEGTSVWAIRQIDDITNDGIDDVIIGDFTGYLYGLDATTGDQVYTKSLGYAIITRLVVVDDVNADGHPDVLPAHSSSSTVYMVDGQTGEFIWGHPVADQPQNIERIADISGDGINDVVVGTLYSNNYCYFLDGTDGSEIHAIPLGTPVDAISTMPDIVGDNSWEMVAGGRNGMVYCFSGGLDAIDLQADFQADITEGDAPLTVHFTDLSTGENQIISWEWDFDNDGVIDSEDQHPQWTYTEPGTYTVSLTVSDGVVSDTTIKQDYMTVYAHQASLELGTIAGGFFKIKAELINTGDVEVTDINWTISVDGHLVLLGKNFTDMISSLAVNDSILLINKPVCGLGRITITVTAEAPGVSPVSKTAQGFLLFCFILLTN